MWRLRKLAAVGLGPEVSELSPAELGRHAEAGGLARAIAAEPEIIFFDEPTTGLDPIMSQVINELIKKCVTDLGATALSITHDMHSLRAIADRAAMIYEGKIIWAGDAGYRQFRQSLCRAVRPGPRRGPDPHAGPAAVAGDGEGRRPLCLSELRRRSSALERNAMPAAPGTPLSRKRRATQRQRASGKKGRGVEFVGLDGAVPEAIRRATGMANLTGSPAAAWCGDPPS